MFALRAEFRTLLRHDIARARSPLSAISLGIASSVRLISFKAKQEAKSSQKRLFGRINSRMELLIPILYLVGEKPLKQGVKLRRCRSPFQTYHSS